MILTPRSATPRMATKEPFPTRSAGQPERARVSGGLTRMFRLSQSAAVLATPRGLVSLQGTAHNVLSAMKPIGAELGIP